MWLLIRTKMACQSTSVFALATQCIARLPNWILWPRFNMFGFWQRIFSKSEMYVSWVRSYTNIKVNFGLLISLKKYSPHQDTHISIKVPTPPNTDTHTNFLESIAHSMCVCVRSEPQRKPINLSDSYVSKGINVSRWSRATAQLHGWFTRFSICWSI